MTFKSRAYKEPTNPVGTVAELFAGVGGFRIGLARAGWKTVFSNQWEPSTKIQHASDVYVAQFGEEGHSNKDISKVEEIEPKKFDLLVGGFPCQDYSVAKTLNSAKGIKGKKGVLWWEILRLVDRYRPKFIFLENVDRLLKSPSSQRGRDFAVMLRTLGDVGYTVEWRVVNAADYGFPQRRIRVFIVAVKNKKGTKNRSPKNYLEKTGILAQALPIKHIVTEILEFSLDKEVDIISSQFNKGIQKSPFLNSGFYQNGSVYTVKSFPKSSTKALNLGDILQPDSTVPNEYWVEGERIKEWKYLKGAKSVERFSQRVRHPIQLRRGKYGFPRFTN